MKFWIDNASETENVVVVTDAAILIGSCDKEACGLAEQQLAAGKNPLEVLGSDDLTSIPFTQIQKLTSRSTDCDACIEYKAKKEIEDKLVFFDDVPAKQDFIAALDGLLPDHLVRSEVQQSPQAAAFKPMISLLLSIGATYLFIDKLRWPAIVIGGLWAAGSLYMLLSRAASPPTVTRWTVGGRYARKLWGHIKFATSFAFVTLVVVVGSEKIPDAWGPQSLAAQLAADNLTAASVGTFLERGAYIDYPDENGDTPLARALDWGQDDIAIALIDAGANLTIKTSYDLTPVEYAVYYGVDLRVIKAMVRKGANLDFEIDGKTTLEYARANDLAELEAYLLARQELLSSSSDF